MTGHSHHHQGSEHGHEHGHAHGHAHAMHTPPADALAAHADAHQAAQPAPGGRVITVDLEAREADWEFVPGKPARVWAYNGWVPGPVLEGRVGDVLEVRLTNRLPEPTTIHWHGLRLAPPMDGTDSVQRPVAPGETFTYRFLLRDAGTFWYHPHMNETVQLERGLYGPIVVRGADEPELDAERVLVLDDVKLDRAGRIVPLGGFVERHDGRQGDTLLVNGDAKAELSMAAGQIERWRIVNAASARYVRLSIGGRPFTLLGTGGGLLTAPVSVTEVLLTPADRADVAVGPFAEGETIAVESLPYNRRTIKRTKRATFATVKVGAAAPSKARIPTTLRSIEPLVAGPAAATREVHLGVRPSLSKGLKFVVNGETHHRDAPVKVGELQVWDVVNDTLMDHPFHLHGYFFQVVSVNEQAPPFLSWEDTVNIPPRSRVRIAWMPDDRPGEWMYHCHILEHHEAGMMGHFAVVP
jgi:FtsP/CotA-like multicopper oxidase with cupredoxin domain